MAGLLLAERVVTLLPAPWTDASRDRAEALADRLPRFRRLMQSWEWLVPLWRAGVVNARFDGVCAVDEAREACRTLTRDGRYAALAPLMRPELFDDEQHYLDAISHDLNRAGPDPGITVPMLTGLDWFAVRTGLFVARADPASVVQKAELQLGRRVLATAAPVLLQAGPHAILRAREILDGELGRWRAALQAATEPSVEEEVDPSKAAMDELAAASKELATAFNANRESFEDDEDEVAVVDGMVRITAVSLPADAVLASSVAAMRRLTPVGAGRGGNGSDALTPARLDLPALAHPYHGRRFLTLVISVIGRAGRR